MPHARTFLSDQPALSILCSLPCTQSTQAQLQGFSTLTPKPSIAEEGRGAARAAAAQTGAHAWVVQSEQVCEAHLRGKPSGIVGQQGCYGGSWG